MFFLVKLDYYMLFSDRNLFRLAVCKNLQKCNFFAWNVSNESKCMLPFLNVVLNFFCKLINYAHKKFPSKFIHWLDTNPLSNWISKKDWKVCTFEHNFFSILIVFLDPFALSWAQPWISPKYWVLFSQEAWWKPDACLSRNLVKKYFFSNFYQISNFFPFSNEIITEYIVRVTTIQSWFSSENWSWKRVCM